MSGPASRLSSLKQLIGLGPQLRRRSDGGNKLDLAFGAIIGVVSGGYMFGEPLREHFKDQEEEERVSKQRVQQLANTVEQARK
ncbi:hypothetical protein TeGR_g1097 [Tetraparma gracilis]|uniref:YtxH domain-containing protein n=1 Tax=Tetraparma gracilis TaxID=2962635 RepID=A0ABQ6N235_9STRA|nr:hypothetical protein TeGR_g1097 [Tetraparma gracilis]